MYSIFIIIFASTTALFQNLCNNNKNNRNNNTQRQVMYSMILNRCIYAYQFILKQLVFSCGK
jgi:hypothetical protein